MSDKKGSSAFAYMSHDEEVKVRLLLKLLRLDTNSARDVATVLNIMTSVEKI